MAKSTKDCDPIIFLIFFKFWFLEKFDFSTNSISRKLGFLENSVLQITLRKSRQLQLQQLNQLLLQRQLARQQHQRPALHRLWWWKNLLKKNQSATRNQRKSRISKNRSKQLLLGHLLWVFHQCVRLDTPKEQKMKHAKMPQNGETMLLSKFLKFHPEQTYAIWSHLITLPYG